MDFSEIANDLFEGGGKTHPERRVKPLPKKKRVRKPRAKKIQCYMYTNCVECYKWRWCEEFDSRYACGECI